MIGICAVVAHAWLGWSDWTFVESGSVDFRARVETRWGGFAVMANAGVRPMTDPGRSAVVARAGIDPSRPMRELSRSDTTTTYGYLFAVATREDPAPDGCRYVTHDHETALACGDSVPAQALADDFEARGFATRDARSIHGELAYARADEPHASFELSEDDHGFRLELRASPPPAPHAILVSKSAFAAALRVAPHPVTVYGLGGRVSFDPRAIDPSLDPGATLVFDDVAFVAEVASFVAQWREQVALSDRSARFAFGSRRAPAGLPRGTRAFRTTYALTDSGEILGACTPQQVMGGCKVIGHRAPRTTFQHTDVALVPADGGTWEAIAIDPDFVRAFFAAPTPPTPETWQLPAYALGIDALPTGTLSWCVTPTANGEERLTAIAR